MKVGGGLPDSPQGRRAELARLGIRLRHVEPVGVGDIVQQEIREGGYRTLVAVQRADMTAGAAGIVEVVFSLVDSLSKARIVRERSRRRSQVGAEEDEIYEVLVSKLRVADRIGVDLYSEIRQEAVYCDAHLVDERVGAEIGKAGNARLVTESSDPAIDHEGPAGDPVAVGVFRVGVGQDDLVGELRDEAHAEEGDGVAGREVVGALGGPLAAGLQGELVHDVKVFDVEQPEVKNALNSFASPTPAIEEGRLYVHFGTYGTACLDTGSGEILWARRDLTLDHQEGPGSSVILHGDHLIFHCDGRDIQYLVALNKQTGKTAWKTTRSIDLSVVGDFARKAFSTPLIVTDGGVTQLVSPAAQGCYSYDPATGKELWRVRYSGFSAVPSPVFTGGKVHVITDFAKPEIWAVRLDGRGDVTETHVDWTFSGSVSSTPSVVAADGLLYFVADKTGVASCLDLESGELVWRHRIGGSFSASPILSGDHVYFFDRDGQTTVLAHGRTLKVLSVNELEAGCMASPAASDGALYLRTTTHLYRIEATAR